MKTIQLFFFVLLGLMCFATVQASVEIASFTVTKQFEDYNPNTEASVDLTLSCDDGNPIDETTDFQDGDTKTFVVTNFGNDMNCHVEEDPLDGYTSDVDACIWSDIDPDDDGLRDFSCIVYNYPNLVELEICKEWVVDNASDGGSDVGQDFELTLTCDNPVYADAYTSGSGSYEGHWWVEFEGEGDKCDSGFTAAVEPDWKGNKDSKGVARGTKCWVNEADADSSVESDPSDCEGLYFAIGSDDQSCTVVNTVFYEGIPTLSQYGMAIMALLMLGVGFVGFRRFV